VAEESELWALNRRVLEADTSCRRFTALEQEGLCRMMLRNVVKIKEKNPKKKKGVLRRWSKRGLSAE
jgi:hypothetical protein